MLQNSDNEDNKDINFNILTDVNSNTKCYEYSHDNYIIIFEIQNSKLTIEIQNKINSEKYQKQYTQDELIQINKVFSMFDNVEDCINIIEMNKNNFSILTEDNMCILTIKLDTQELPKNKISDKIIFNIPLIPLMPLKLDKNNSNMSQINRNLLCLKIESNVALESINNASPRYSNKSNSNNNSNVENLNNIVQNLVSKIDKLSEENKEIKERLKVLEENNNKLINIIKENRIQSLKEKNNLENSSVNIFINNNSKKDTNNKITFEGNFDLGNSSFSNQNETNSENQNYLTKVYSNFLKNKTKNKTSIEEGIINNKKSKNKENINLSLNDADDYFYSEKFDVNIIDDVGLFKKEKMNQTPDISNKKKYNEDYYILSKNIMKIDENEEEKKNMIKKDEDEAYIINGSYNMVGGVCLEDGNQNKNNINKDKKKSYYNMRKEDSQEKDEYYY